MTTMRLATENRRRQICNLLTKEPRLTHEAITKRVGCWRAYASKVAGQEPPYVGSGPGADERKWDGEPTECARLLESGWLTHWSPIPWNPRVGEERA